MTSDALPTEPSDELHSPTPESVETEALPPQAPSPQAPAALGGMGSTGPITVVRKKP